MGIGPVFRVSLQGAGSGVSGGLHCLGVYSNQNLLGTLPGGWGFLGLWIPFLWFPSSVGVGFLVWGS